MQICQASFYMILGICRVIGSNVQGLRAGQLVTAFRQEMGDCNRRPRRAHNRRLSHGQWNGSHMAL